MDNQEAAQQLIAASRRNLGARDREAAAIQAQLAAAHATLHLADVMERTMTGKRESKQGENGEGEDSRQ